MKKQITNILIVVTLLTGLSVAAVFGFTTTPVTGSSDKVTIGLQNSNKALQNSNVADTSSEKQRIIKKKKKQFAR